MPYKDPAQERARGRRKYWANLEAERERARLKAKARREAMVIRNREWRAENPGANAAHCAVQVALRKGLLVRPDACEDCGQTGRPEAHHEDYERQLDVQWPCRQCHKKAHGYGT